VKYKGGDILENDNVWVRIKTYISVKAKTLNLKGRFEKIPDFKELINIKLNYKSLVSACVVAALVVSTVNLNVDTNKVYKININDKVIGYLETSDEYEKLVKIIKATDGVDTTQLITAKKVRDKDAKLSSSEELEKIARKELHLKMPGVIVSVDGKELFNAASKEDADRILEDVKKYYLSSIGYKDIDVKSTNIKENISISTNMIEPEKIMTAKDAYNMIIKGKGTEKTYEVQKGDTLWDIAIKNNTTIENIQSLNKTEDINKLQIGQKVKLSAREPYLNVETVADVKIQEPIPYDIEKVADSSINKGTSKVKQKGTEGLADVEKTITFVNGNEVSEKVLNKAVVQQPVKQVVAVGNKNKSYNSSSSYNVASSGKFIQPSRGYFSSYFGNRGSGYHTGLDIAGSTGSPIVAAESGVVSFAGWNGNYGNCVIISHGGGYQTLYGHASKIYVHQGQRVSRGDTVAAVGSTGRSTGPHCHFEVRLNGAPQNPLKYIR
jgi:murein DD-endopeptidase MepM/ murein hydrolase activator NlpD